MLGVHPVTLPEWHDAIEQQLAVLAVKGGGVHHVRRNAAHTLRSLSTSPGKPGHAARAPLSWHFARVPEGWTLKGHWVAGSCSAREPRTLSQFWGPLALHGCAPWRLCVEQSVSQHRCELEPFNPILKVLAVLVFLGGLGYTAHKILQL
jgi:hypothetical protein